MASYKPGDTYIQQFFVQNVLGVTNADALPVATVTYNGTDSGTSPTGWSNTLTVTNMATGRYKVMGTIPATYAAGDRIQISITCNVSSIPVGDVIDDFVLDAVRMGDVIDSSNRVKANEMAINSVATTAVTTVNAVLGQANTVTTNASGQVTISNTIPTPPSTTAIATAVWTDTTGSDFTTAGSPGKELQTTLPAAVSAIPANTFNLALLIAGQWPLAISNDATPITLTESPSTTGPVLVIDVPPSYASSSIVETLTNSSVTPWTLTGTLTVYGTQTWTLSFADDGDGHLTGATNSPDGHMQFSGGIDYPTGAISFAVLNKLGGACTFGACSVTYSATPVKTFYAAGWFNSAPYYTTTGAVICLGEGDNNGLGWVLSPTLNGTAVDYSTPSSLIGGWNSGATVSAVFILPTIDSNGNVSAVDAATVPSGENPAGTAAIAAGTIKATDTAGNALATSADLALVKTAVSEIEQATVLASGVVASGSNTGTSLFVSINSGTLMSGYSLVLTSAATGATATATVSSLNGGTGLPSTAPTLTLSAAPAGYTVQAGDSWVAVEAAGGLTTAEHTMLQNLAMRFVGAGGTVVLDTSADTLTVHNADGSVAFTMPFSTTSTRQTFQPAQ